MKKLFILLTLLILTGLGFVVYYNFVPQDLSDVDGYEEKDRDEDPVQLRSIIERAAKLRKPVELTELEVNSWLAANLKTKQEGLFGDYVELKSL